MSVVPVPLMVKGELLHPRIPAPRILAEAAEDAERARGASATSFYCEDVLVRPQPGPGLQPSDQGARFLVFPRLEPSQLLERDPAELARTLYALPTREVLAFAAALRAHLASRPRSLVSFARGIDPGLLGDGAFVEMLFAALPALLDPEALGAALDQELAYGSLRGRGLLDGWMEVDQRVDPGMLARLATSQPVPGGALGGGSRCQVRAMPTRQLHITAGNALVVPFVSFLRGLLTKGACVVKCASDAAAMAAILAAAMREVDARHPITRHTSLVYWPGGDPGIESVLFAPGAFDRVVVWGGSDAVRSVVSRVAETKTIVFPPRYGFSVVGRESLGAGMQEAARRAAADSLVWNQRACTASLVHYVESDEAGVLDYCRALQEALAEWDRVLPGAMPRASLGRVRLLRRGALVRGTWFTNGEGAALRSAVVYSPDAFELSLHPFSRLVVVRRLERLEDVLRFVGGAVSSVGISSASALERLRDPLAAAGVTHVFRLGGAEQAFAGMPQDGMRVSSELVSWVVSGGEPAAITRR